MKKKKLTNNQILDAFINLYKKASITWNTKKKEKFFPGNFAIISFIKNTGRYCIDYNWYEDSMDLFMNCRKKDFEYGTKFIDAILLQKGDSVLKCPKMYEDRVKIVDNFILAVLNGLVDLRPVIFPSEEEEPLLKEVPAHFDYGDGLKDVKTPLPQSPQIDSPWIPETEPNDVPLNRREGPTVPNTVKTSNTSNINTNEDINKFFICEHMLPCGTCKITNQPCKRLYPQEGKIIYVSPTYVTPTPYSPEPYDKGPTCEYKNK